MKHFGILAAFSAVLVSLVLATPVALARPSDSHAVLGCVEKQAKKTALPGHSQIVDVGMRLVSHQLLSVTLTFSQSPEYMFQMRGAKDLTLVNFGWMSFLYAIETPTIVPVDTIEKQGEQFIKNHFPKGIPAIATEINTPILDYLYEEAGIPYRINALVGVKRGIKGTDPVEFTENYYLESKLPKPTWELFLDAARGDRPAADLTRCFR